MKEYNKDNIAKARNLRSNMTEWERKLWYCFLRNYPLKFRKQVPIDMFIADFYCHEAKLVIEIDGQYHKSKKQYEYDLQRTAKFAELGIRVYRVTNYDIYKKFDTVCNQIDYLIKSIQVKTI